MGAYKLDLNTESIGGYFSTEQIDLLTIVRSNFVELKEFILNCEQFKGKYTEESIDALFKLDEEIVKRKLFKEYQDTLIYHDENKLTSLVNSLKHCGITEKEDIEQISLYVKMGRKDKAIDFIKTNDKYKDKYDEIVKSSHRFFSLERDNLKDDSLFDEFILLNASLNQFNTMLIGSGKIYEVVNDFYPISEKEEETHKRYDFYKAKRDLDFAYKNGKKVRYHSLLVRDEEVKYFKGKNKEDIIAIIKDFVKNSVDFINDYNKEHSKDINGKDIYPVINAIDLFNEIVTFDEMIFDKQDNIWRSCKYDEKTLEYKVKIGENLYRDLRDGEVPDYQNMWEMMYGISLEELLICFDYALENKNGISYLYNEPFMENDKRRKKVFDILNKIDEIKPGLIDTIGTQTHITITEPIDKIERCFKDLYELQVRTGKKVQITEFDMSLGSRDVLRVFGKNADVSLEQVYQYKAKKIKEIEQVIEDSKVNFTGVSYWSLTDVIDSNLERLRSNYLKSGKITDIKKIPTACGGLYPTYALKHTREITNQ